MRSAGLYLVPTLTVAFVATVLLVLGRGPEPYAAQLYGGPTEGVPALTLRLQLVEATRTGRPVSRAGTIEITAEFSDGRRASWQGLVDEQGTAAVRIAPAGGPVTGPVLLRVAESPAGRVLARGAIRLGRDEWMRGAVWRGGWIPGKQTGSLSVRIAPGRGVLPISIEEPLVIEVHQAGAPVAGARLTFQADGLALSPGPEVSPKTNHDGRLVVMVRPTEPVCALRVEAVLAAASRGDFYARLPVVQGALHGSLQGDRLRIVSPIPRDRAYFALLSAQGRLAGGSVRLAADRRGTLVGYASLPALPLAPLWAVVASDPGLSSASAVGWPLLRRGAAGAPEEAGLVESIRASGHRRSLTVPDRLLLDGGAQAAEADASRRATARWLCLAVIAAGLGLVLWLILHEHQCSQPKLRDQRPPAEPLSEPERSYVRPRRIVWRLVVALACVVLGFSLLALWVHQSL